MNSVGIGPDSIIARAKDLPMCLVDDAMVAIDAQAGYYYVLNATSNRIWELISPPADVKSLCRRLCIEYEVAPDICLSDVMSLLEDLREGGLISVANASSAFD